MPPRHPRLWNTYDGVVTKGEDVVLAAARIKFMRRRHSH